MTVASSEPGPVTTLVGPRLRLAPAEANAYGRSFPVRSDPARGGAQRRGRDRSCAGCSAGSATRAAVEAICRAGDRRLLDRRVLRRARPATSGSSGRAISRCARRRCAASASANASSSHGPGPRAVRARRADDHDDLQPALPARRLRLRVRLAAAACSSLCARRAPSTWSTGTASCSPARSSASTRSSSIPKLGLARTDGYFSGPRDCMTGRSTVFANTMIALLARCSTTSRACRTRSGATTSSGACCTTTGPATTSATRSAGTSPRATRNVWPFFFGVFPDPEMRGARSPPSRTRASPARCRCAYFERRLPDSELPVPRLFTPELPGRPQLDPARPRLPAGARATSIGLGWSATARRMAAAHRARPQLPRALHQPRQAPTAGARCLYHADEGMIWAAMFLDLF